MNDNETFPTNRASDSHTESDRAKASQALEKVMNGETMKTPQPSVCKAKNEGCKSHTSRRSGFCALHEKKYEHLLTGSVLKCSRCFVSADCPHADNDLGYCVFEIGDNGC
jgi:hypothetical protein